MNLYKKIYNHFDVGFTNQSRMVAICCAIFLGCVGMHKFYLNRVNAGLLYLAFFWTGIPFILGIIEGIYIFASTDNNRDFQRKFVEYRAIPKAVTLEDF